MSYQSRRMNSIFTLSIIVVFANIRSTLGLQCYVCGTGSEEPFMQTSRGQLEYSDMDIPLSCDEFDNSDNLNKFIFTCPPNYVGCITQSDGTEVTRTCDELAMNDCQTANDVEYCYCNTDLCNKRKSIPVPRRHDTFYDDEDASDMDAFESSGYGPSDTISSDTIETLGTTITISSAASSLSPTIRMIEPTTSDVTVARSTTTVTTTTEAITSNKVFTTSYNQSHTIPSTTAESTTDANTSSFVKCSKVIFIMQLLMLIFPLCY